ncbi:hypothetical protein JCM6882_009389 [Rhodosporidiobolus microsporus]
MDVDEDMENGPGPPASAQATGSVVSASSEASTSTHGIGHDPAAATKTTGDLADALPSLAQDAVAPSSPPPHSSSSTSPRLPHLADILNTPSTIHAFAPDDADLSSTIPPSTSSSGPLSSGVPAPASPQQSHTLRQIALYQALAARQQQPHPSSNLPPFPSFPSHLSPLSTFGPPSLPPFHLPHAPPPTPALPQYTSSSGTQLSSTENDLSTDTAMPPASHKWQTSLEGLNVVPDPTSWSTSANHGPARSGPAAGLGSVSADELLAAQASLDLWASTSFSSPGLPASLSLASTPVSAPAPHLPSLHHPISAASAEHHSAPPSSLDWTALYPHGNPFSPPGGSGSLPLPSASSLGLSQHSHPHSSSVSHAPSLSHSIAAPHPVDLHGSQFSNLFSSAPHHLTANGAVGSDSQSPQQSPPPTANGTRPTPSRRSSRPNAGAKGRAARASYSGAGDAGSEDGDVSPGEMSGGSSGVGLGVGITAAGKKVPRELMTADEIEEDKRRRNTEASARFRAKKKLRDQELQQSSASLRERVANLEKEKESLTNENRWLRDIVAEKAEVQPHLLDVLRRSSVSEG